MAKFPPSPVRESQASAATAVPQRKPMLDTPHAVKLDAKGLNLYIGDYDNNRVRMVVLSTGIITTVAGTDDFQYSGDKGPATQAGLDPDDIAVDAASNIYIADYTNSRIRKVSAADGTITTIAGIAAQATRATTGPRSPRQSTDQPVSSVDAQNNVVLRRRL